MEDSTRRNVLLTGGTIGIGAVSGLAGCLDDVSEFVDEELDGEGGLTDGDSEDDDGTEPPSFHEWLYAPESVGLGAYTHTYADIETLEREDVEPFENWRELGWIGESFDGLTADEEFADAEAALAVNYHHENEDEDTFGNVILGGIDLAELRSELDEEAEEHDDIEVESYAGYDVYFDDQFAVALGEGIRSVCLLGSAAPDAAATGWDVLEALINARAGDGARLYETDETAATLLDHLGEQQLVFGATEPTGRAESLFDHEDVAIDGVGVAFRADGDAGSYRVIAVTADPVADADAFEDGFAVTDRLDDPTVTVDDKIVSIEGNVDEDPVEEPEQEPEPEPGMPRAGFDVDIDHDRGEATIVHVGGDEVHADNLDVVVESRDFRQDSWSVFDDTETITAGDAISIPISDDDSGGFIYLYWTPEGAILHEAHIPEPESGSGSAGPPSAGFDAEFDWEGGEVTVSHVHGDEIPADELLLIFLTDSSREIHWRELADESTVTAGSTATTGLSEHDQGGHLLIGWEPEQEVIDEIPIPSE